MAFVTGPAEPRIAMQEKLQSSTCISPPHTTSDLGGLRVCLVSTERRRGFPGARWRFSAGGWGGGRSVRCETLFMKTTLTQTASQILQFQSCPWEILMEAELCQNIYLDRAIHILSLQFSNA